MSETLRRPSPKPAEFDETAFFEGIHWHQRWELFEGVFTPGRNPVAELMDYAAVPHDLTGKTVLDIGPWNGGFSLECARRGASRVLGFGPDNPEQTGFFKLRDLLDFGQVDYMLGSVYDLDTVVHDSFDIVLFFGVIYHLRYPLLALDRIYPATRESVFVESFVCDNHFLAGPERTPANLAGVDARLAETPIWEFFRRDELYGDSSNWFGPNVCALREAMESAGFSVYHTQSWGDRAALAGRKARCEFLDLNTYERHPIVAGSVRLRRDSNNSR
jgi:tRNA (mo5U34)-methyltransferase